MSVKRRTILHSVAATDVVAEAPPPDGGRISVQGHVDCNSRAKRCTWFR